MVHLPVPGTFRGFEVSARIGPVSTRSSGANARNEAAQPASWRGINNGARRVDHRAFDAARGETPIHPTDRLDDDDLVAACDEFPCRRKTRKARSDDPTRIPIRCPPIVGPRDLVLVETSL